MRTRAFQNRTEGAAMNDPRSKRKQFNTNWSVRNRNSDYKAGDGAKALAGLRKLEHLLKIKGASDAKR